MTTQSLPDDAVRSELARRAGVGAGTGEVEEILSALDRMPVRSGPRLVALPDGRRHSARTAAGALVSLAGVAAVLALVFVALPAFRSGPGTFAGYPADRALTTAELAKLVEGPSLPVNTTIVVEATIDAGREYWRNPCAMDRYPMLGVIAGMSPEPCIMAPDLAPVPTGGQLTGTFALRYIGRGEVPAFLYLGQLTAPPSGHTFRVTDDWPLQGRTFLVDGWLGALFRGPIPCPSSPVDPLMGYSADCAYESWLSTDSTSDLSFDQWPSDAISLVGNSRVVDATGVLELAGEAPHDKPVHGIYVVRTVVTACPGAAAIDSRGCASWKVLGKVDDLSAVTIVPPSPTPTAPAAVTTAETWNPAERPLDPAELSKLLDEDRVPGKAVVVLSGDLIDAGNCASAGGYTPIARIGGIGNDVCVVGIAGGGETSRPATSSGVFALRYLGGRTLGFMGTVTTSGSDRLAYHADEAWPDSGTIVVTGWLLRVNGLSPSCEPVARLPKEPLDPPAAACDYLYVLSPKDQSGDQAYSQGAPKVRLPDYGSLTAQGLGTYLLRLDPKTGTRVLAALEPIRLADTTGPASTPSVRPLDTPSLPKAVPTPLPPNSPLAPVAPALIGAGNVPLTWDDYQARVKADPEGMNGRTAIVISPPISDGSCAVRIVPNGQPPVCTVPANASPDDVWAVRDNGGLLELVAKIARPEATAITTLGGAIRATTTKAGTYYLVDAWLHWGPTLECDLPPYPPDSLCGAGAASSYLTTSAYGDRAPADGVDLQVGLGDFQRFGSLDLTTGPVHGLFLVRIVTGTDCTPTGNGQDQPGEVCGTFGSVVGRVESA